jgi:hypothetical protein
VIGAYGDTESNKSKLNLLISQKACEDILLKVKMSWGNLNPRSESNFGHD